MASTHKSNISVFNSSNNLCNTKDRKKPHLSYLKWCEQNILECGRGYDSMTLIHLVTTNKVFKLKYGYKILKFHTKGLKCTRQTLSKTWVSWKVTTFVKQSTVLDTLLLKKEK